jgi:hypothetical protein
MNEQHREERSILVPEAEHPYVLCAENHAVMASAKQVRIVDPENWREEVSQLAAMGRWFKKDDPKIALPPHRGHWYTVARVDQTTSDVYGLRQGDYVLADLTFRSHKVTITGMSVSVFPEDKIVGRLKTVGAQISKPSIEDFRAVGDWVVCKPNDERHQQILRRDRDSGLVMPTNTLLHGQRTSEDPTDDLPVRENDGIRTTFMEVVAVGPDAATRALVGDMICFKSVGVCTFELGGTTYSSVKVPKPTDDGKKQATILMRIPGEAFGA